MKHKGERFIHNNKHRPTSSKAYYTKGDMQKALDLYQKSLELNPANDNGKKFIERINEEMGI